MSTQKTVFSALLLATLSCGVARAQEPYEAPDASANGETAGRETAGRGTAASTLVIDDFERGVADWTRNDKTKSDNPSGDVLLVDIIASGTPSTAVRTSIAAPASGSAALFSFKAARDSWASASRRVSGARWAQIGAQRLTFWLNGDGAETGTELLLRARVRQDDGTARDEVYAVPLKLRNKSWRRVVVPLANIRNANGFLLPNIAGVYLLQFAQRGSWTSRFFTVDQVQIEGTGKPLVQTVRNPATGSIGGTTSATSANPTAPQLQVNVDFLKKQGRLRTGANVSIGASDATASGAASYPLMSNTQFRTAIKTLAPRYIRLDASSLVELVDSQRPAFDFSRLVAATKQARALGSEPLIALVNDPAWGLDERGYALFASGAARVVNAGNSRPVRLFELVTGASPSGETGDVALSIAFYNRARTAIKALSALNRVGGVGASSGQSGALLSFLQRAQGLDFLSLQFYAGNSGAARPDDAALFGGARALKNLRASTAVLDKSRFRQVPLFVTQSNLNGARDDGTLLPSDTRTTQMISAAWWATYLGTSSRLADQVFYNDAVNPEWGLLNPDGPRDAQGLIQIAYPAYYALWMWNSFFPLKSERVLATATRAAGAPLSFNAQDVSVVAANTSTSHNVMLANTRADSLTMRLTIRGFPVLRAAVMHVFEDPSRGVRRSVPLPKSPFQTITLRPYSVAVIQFIEPPRTP